MPRRKKKQSTTPTTQDLKSQVRDPENRAKEEQTDKQLVSGSSTNSNKGGFDNLLAKYGEASNATENTLDPLRTHHTYSKNSRSKQHENSENKGSSRSQNSKKPKKLSVKESPLHKEDSIQPSKTKRRRPKKVNDEDTKMKEWLERTTKEFDEISKFPLCVKNV